MTTRYRLHQPEDIDALVQFWSENSGWDQIDRTEWERRFHYTPYGSATVTLAEDAATREIVGQFIFIPTLVHIDERTVKGYRPFALVVKKSYTSTFGYLKMIEIVAKMYNHTIHHFRKSGIGLIHFMPDPRWSRLLKFIPDLQIGSFPLWSLPLPLTESFQLPSGYGVNFITPADERINTLWESGRKLHGCSIARNTTLLPWKISHGDYLLQGIFKQGELKGVVAFIAKCKDKQWLICDVIASDNDESLIVTLQAACNYAHAYRNNLEAEALHKIAILATPLIEKAIAPLGFKKDNYNFPMLVHLLDASLTKKQVAPERWYASAND